MLPTPLEGPSGYRRLATIRAFELCCQRLSVEGAIAGSIHLCAGQEAIPVGVVDALGDHDRVVATYRGHGWAIALGVPLPELLGEICHRDGGINGGRGGSALLTAPHHRLVGENSIVGAGAPIATGIGLAHGLRRNGGAVVVSIGDGAMNQGATHEAIVFAVSRDLPVLFVCENNGWSEMTPTSVTTRGDLSRRVEAYGAHSEVVDGCDVTAVAAAAGHAVKRARDGGGPQFLECRTVRLLGHYNRDVEHYRSQEDRDRAADSDPLCLLRHRLIESGMSEDDLNAIDREVDALIDGAEEQARSMPSPDPARARDHVFGPVSRSTSQPAAGSPIDMPYWRAVNEALDRELSSRSEVLVYGEDVGAAGGIFGATRGLQKRHGPERVFDTPISESAILGSAVGAAIAGCRPVVEIMWADFLLVALDQIINQAANVRYVSGGLQTAPLVVRTQQGITPGSCAQHSQSLEAILAHVPGIRVGLPGTPQDAYSMLRAAVADDDPTIVVEARLLYQMSGPVVVEQIESIGGARLRREGTAFGIITWGAIQHEVLAAAELLAGEGIDAAVLDLRWLNPLDDDAIAALVGLTGGRLAVVHEANVTGGFGAEVAARIQERHFFSLDAPVRRLGLPDVRVPAAPALQSELLPDRGKIAHWCRELLTRQ